MKKDRTQSKPIRGMAFVIGAALAEVVCTGAIAQESPVNDTQLAEIVVTAQKREQRLQDVPMAVTAVSGAQLEQQGITDFRQLLRSVPGVSFAGTEPGQSRYTIRGISTEASSPTTGVYLDDISLVTVSTSFAGAIDPAFFDFDRVEVLKGPQGTLYGGSAMGGAIKYVSRQPQLNKFTVGAAAGFASTKSGDPSYEVETVLNAPLVDDLLAVRAGVLYRKSGGYLDNVANGNTQVWTQSATQPPAPFQPVTYSTLSTFDKADYNSNDLVAVRLSAKLAPSSTLNIVPAVFYQRNDKKATDNFFTNLPEFQSSYRYAEPTIDKVGIYSITATDDFGSVGLTSITAYSDRKINWDRDYGPFIGSLVPALAAADSFNISDTGTQTFSQEIRLASNPGAGAWQWVAGLFYSDQKDRLFQSVNTAGAGALFGTGTDVTYVGDQKTKSKQYAVFGELTYKVLPRLDLTLGLRWFELKQTVNGDFDGVFNGGHSAVDNKRSTDVGFTPKVSLSFHATDDNLIYGTASKGFRQGGPNRFNTSSPLCGPDFVRLGIDRAPDSFGPDSLWTYELGSKNQLFERRTTINMAAYYTDWKKIQQQVNLPSCGFQFVSNIGAATVKGAELGVETLIASAFTVGGTATYTDAKITESAPGVSAQVGQSVLDTPKWMGNVYAEYAFHPVADWKGDARVEYQYRDSSLRQFDDTVVVRYPDASVGSIANTAQIQQSYHLVNASLALFHDNWQYRLYVDNLLDDSPYLSFSRSEGASFASTLRPRTIGVGVRVNF